jgi:hypothetical protein
MCGCCVESGVIRDRLEVMKGNEVEAIESFLRMIHLQEARDWREELRAWGSPSDVGASFVALCRQWSERLAGKHPMSLEQTLGTDALIDLQAWLAPFDYPPEWRWVLQVDGIAPEPLPIDLARAELDAYISGWIKPALPGAAYWDHKILMERFLRVSVAFDIVFRYAIDDARMQLLATLSPSQAPYFHALELWLGRRALDACVAYSGVPFINTHFNELRVEAIISIVMGDRLTRNNLLELKASLKGRSHNSMYLGIDDLIETLETKLDCLPEST